MRKCHFCHGDIGNAAIICPHCRKDTIARQAPAPPEAVHQRSLTERLSSAATVFAHEISQPPPVLDRRRYCQHCGTLAVPKKRVKGSFLIELILWCCFLVPGIIYSVWRLTSKELVCPACAAPNMIPLDSPIALAARAKS